MYDLNVTTEEYKGYCSHMREFILDTFCQQKQPEGVHQEVIPENNQEMMQEPEQNQMSDQIPQEYNNQMCN